MNLKTRVGKLEAKANPVITEMDMFFWRMHLQDHPDDDPLPPPSRRGLTLERLLRECVDED
jgi:hypothetical protein